jgi:hypothetical protein
MHHVEQEPNQAIVPQSDFYLCRELAVLVLDLQFVHAVSSCSKRMASQPCAAQCDRESSSGRISRKRMAVSLVSEMVVFEAIT